MTSHAAQGKTVDEVMVVASSRSFAAVSQESFYVGISRARERARIYTDDAELLGRRVEATHTRKAAIELEGLRDALKQAGFWRPPTPSAEMPTEARRAHIGPTLGRAWRQMRELRAERLAPVQRVARRWTQTFKRWLGERVFAQQRMRPDAPRASRGMRI